MTFSSIQALINVIKTCINFWVFSVSSPQPYWQNYYFPRLADMLSWAAWFKFLLNKVIANTCLFILTSFSKQSASWKVLEICEFVHCLLTRERRIQWIKRCTCTLVAAATASTVGGGGEKRKGPNHFSYLSSSEDLYFVSEVHKIIAIFYSTFDFSKSNRMFLLLIMICLFGHENHCVKKRQTKV